jgi:hypothetical protein
MFLTIESQSCVIKTMAFKHASLPTVPTPALLIKRVPLQRPFDVPAAACSCASDHWQAQPPSLPDQAVVASMEPDEEGGLGGEEVITEVRVNYDYLLGMPIASLTLEKVRRARLFRPLLPILDHASIKSNCPALFHVDTERAQLRRDACLLASHAGQQAGRPLTEGH